MKILAMIMLVLLILAVGFVGYVYKKNAMFLPALFGIGGFPNIKKKDYYQADGTFRKAEKDDKIRYNDERKWSNSMLYVILGIIMVFWAWMQAAMGQLQKHKKCDSQHPL